MMNYPPYPDMNELDQGSSPYVQPGATYPPNLAGQWSSPASEPPAAVPNNSYTEIGSIPMPIVPSPPLPVPAPLYSDMNMDMNMNRDRDMGRRVDRPDISVLPNQYLDPGTALPNGMDAEPESMTNPLYTPGYLKTQIGKTIRVEFLLADTITDRIGRLLAVGASYILLQSLEGASTMMCDLNSIRFVTVANNVNSLL